MTSEWNRIGRCGVVRPKKFSAASSEDIAMKLVTALLVVAAFGVNAGNADAKGCLKGAMVGGVAGHYAGHHGVLGAAAGCLYGRHRAKDQERQQQQAPEQHQSLLPNMDYGQTGM